MAWRINTAPRSVARLVRRHRLYIFGIFAWALTGGLVVFSFQWQAQGPVSPRVAAGTLTVAAPEKAPAKAKPQVAGASTSTPATAPPPQPQSLAQVLFHKPASIVANSSTVLTAILQKPATPALPYAPPEPTVPPAPVVTPDPVTPTFPAGNTPTENLSCVVDPTSTFSLSGIATLTVPVGGQTAVQTVATADGSNVIWQPLQPVIWGDGTTSNPLSPLSMVLAYSPGSLVGSSVSYYAQALASAVPGSVVELSWHVEDGARGICQTMSVPVTIVAPAMSL